MRAVEPMQTVNNLLATFNLIINFSIDPITMVRYKSRVISRWEKQETMEQPNDHTIAGSRERAVGGSPR